MRENMVKIQFPDGKIKEFPAGTTVADVASHISPSLRKKQWRERSMIKWLI